MPLETACHCGGVNIAIASKPDFINDCNCSLCANSGAIWGYFTPERVQTSGETRRYVRRDRPEPAVAIHFCPSCGATTHWVLTEGYQQSSGVTDCMGVNMRLFDENDLTGVEVRYPDGKAWDGSTDYNHRRPEIVLGPDQSL